MIQVPDNSEAGSSSRYNHQQQHNVNLSDFASLISIVALENKATTSHLLEKRAKTHTNLLTNQQQQQQYQQQQSKSSQTLNHNTPAHSPPHLSRQPTASSITLNTNFNAYIDYEKKNMDDLTLTHSDYKFEQKLYESRNESKSARQPSSLSSKLKRHQFDRSIGSSGQLSQRNVNKTIRKSSKNRLEKIYKPVESETTTTMVMASRKANLRSAGEQQPNVDFSSHRHHTTMMSMSGSQLNNCLECHECKRQLKRRTMVDQAPPTLYNLGLIDRTEPPIVRYRRIKEKPVEIIQNIISDIPSTLTTMSQIGRITNIEKIIASKLADFYTNNARV